jgi:hypothetical protein
MRILTDYAMTGLEATLISNEDLNVKIVMIHIPDRHVRLSLNSEHHQQSGGHAPYTCISTLEWLKK